MAKEKARALTYALGVVMADQMTLPELEQHFAKATEVLRGSINASGFQQFIFPQKTYEYTQECH